MADGMPALAQEQAAPESGFATELVAKIHGDMTNLLSMLQGAEGVAGPEDVQAMQTAIRAFEGAVEGLSAEPGLGAQPQQEAMPATAPQTAGAANVQPAM